MLLKPNPYKKAQLMIAECGGGLVLTKSRGNKN